MLLSLAATLVLVFSLEDEDDSALEPMPAKRSSQRSAQVAGASAESSSAPRTAASAASGTQAASTQSASTQSAYLAWNLLQGREAPQSNAAPAGEAADLFRSHHWYVPPPKTAAELAPPPPVAPEPGFAYMGKMEEGPEGTVILLASANRVYSVALGDHIDTSWRLDHEDEQSLKLTYLPLNLPKTLLKKSKAAVPYNPASHLQGDPDDLQGNL